MFDIYVVRIVHAVILSYHFLQQKTMDDILEDTTQQIQHLQKKFLDDHRELIRQNRAMRDELQSYKVSTVHSRQCSTNGPVVIASSDDNRVTLSGTSHMSQQL